MSHRGKPGSVMAGLALFAISFLQACHGSNGSEQFRGKASGPRVNAFVESADSSPELSEKRVADYIAMSFGDVHSRMSKVVNEDTFEIDGLVFSGLSSKLAEAESLYSDLETSFGTIGEHLASLDIDPYQKVSAGEVTEGLQLAEDYHNSSGQWAELKQLLDNHSSDDQEGTGFRLQAEVYESECVNSLEFLKTSEWAMSTADLMMVRAQGMPDDADSSAGRACTTEEAEAAAKGVAAKDCAMGAKATAWSGATASKLAALKASEQSKNFQSLCEKHGYSTHKPGQKQ